MKKQLLLFVMLMLPMVSSAYDIAVENADGVRIYYNYINDGTELAVTCYFRGCYQGVVVIPDEVTYMDITRKVTSIGYNAFYDCGNLTSVTIPNTVTTIEGSAFAYCNGLTSIYIPNSVISIGQSAFEGCSSLTSVTIGDNVNSIGDFAFCICRSLKYLKIGKGVKTIGENAFNECSRLSSLVIPEGVTTIGQRAFIFCSGLTSVTIPSSVTDIGYSAFEGCRNLTSVHVSDLAAWCNIVFGNEYANPLRYAYHIFLNGDEIKSLVIPNNVECIHAYAFEYCLGLTSVTLPNSIKNIEGGAFAYCDFQQVISRIEEPNGISAPFNNNTKLHGTLYVPFGTIEKYKTAEKWKDFANIVEGEPSGIANIEGADVSETRRFTLDGKEIKNSRKGINIIQTKNGKTQKVVVK